MSVVEHIVELRKSNIYGVILCTIFNYWIYFYKGYLFWLVKDLPMKLTVLGPSDVLWIFSRCYSICYRLYNSFCCYTNLVICKTGFTSNEQKMTIMYIPVLSILFIAGLCFGYFIVMPFLFHF